MDKRNEELAIHLYHSGIDWLGKASLAECEVLFAVIDRLRNEAVRADGDDDHALTSLANSLERYANDPHR